MESQYQRTVLLLCHTTSNNCELKFCKTRPMPQLAFSCSLQVVPLRTVIIITVAVVLIHHAICELVAIGIAIVVGFVSDVIAFVVGVVPDVIARC